MTRRRTPRNGAADGPRRGQDGVRRMFRLRSVERDVDEEIAFHFEQLIAELERAGHTTRAAGEEAARQFGDQVNYRRQLVSIDRSAAARERWSRRREAMRHTLKYAVRGIVRSPALSVGIIVAFALGIGANATMYETVERMLLRPPPHIVEPDGVRRLMVYRMAIGERRHQATVAYPDYQDFAATAGFTHVAATMSRELTLGAGESAEQVRGMIVTANYWPLLGVQPALGRFFTADDDHVGADPVAVLSYTRWQRDHGGAGDVLGRTLDFGYGPYTIIGVTPRGFTGADLRPVDFFAPFMVAQTHLAGGTDWIEERGGHFMQSIARLDPAVAIETAEAEATAHHRAGRSGNTYYDSLATVVAAPLLAARGPNAPSEVIVARWLLGVAVVVLLIACLNVANLLLARMLRMRREISIRLAIGISRSRLVGQIVAEGVLLGLLGGGAALLVARWGGTLVQNTLLPEIDWTAGPSATVLIMVLVLSILAGALSALVPAVQASRRDVAAGLRAAAGGITRSTARVRATLTMVQAALSVLLLVGAGLFVRSLDQIHNADFGLALWDVAYVSPTFHTGSIEAEDRWLYFEQAAGRVARLPGISSASVASGIPFWSVYAHPLRADGLDSIPRAPTGGPYANAVDHDYFSTLGVRLQRGRLFDERDTRNAPRVVIINASFAQALWPGEDAVGRCLYIGGPDVACSEIVGIVQDARSGRLIEETTYQYYFPIDQRLQNRQPEALLVRVAAGVDMGRTLAGVQREMVAVDARVRFARSTPLEELVAGELRQWRLGAAMFSLFGVLALFVAAIGLYSVLAFDVAQRVREIGLRSALGASSSAIMRLVVSRALRITGAGVAAGIVLALVFAPRLRDMLYQISPHDPVTFIAVATTLCVASLAAATIPAWRASRVDPNVALRAD